MSDSMTIPLPIFVYPLVEEPKRVRKFKVNIRDVREVKFVRCSPKNLSLVSTDMGREASNSSKAKCFSRKSNNAVLTYSGGLDTSLTAPWTRKLYGCQAVCFAADAGQGIPRLVGLVANPKAMIAKVRARDIVAREAGVYAVDHECTGKGNSQMAMSSVLLDVKPWGNETDMQKLEEAVRSVQMEGLTWGTSKLVPVGFGMKKLQILMTIVDDLVSVDALIEDTLTQEPINEYVQSGGILAFNKI